MHMPNDEDILQNNIGIVYIYILLGVLIQL